jgi:hypothetical protein
MDLGPHIRRQILAVRDCFTQHNNTNQIIGLFDADDEYVWANNYPQQLVPDVAALHDESVLAPCPRFGLLKNISYDPSKTVISQILHRAPLGAAQYNESCMAILQRHEDCKLKCTEPQGTCL